MLLNNENAETVTEKINAYLKDTTFTWLSTDNVQEPRLKTGCTLEAEAVVHKNAQGEKNITFSAAGQHFSFSTFAKSEITLTDGLKIWHTTAVGNRRLEWFKI